MRMRFPFLVGAAAIAAGRIPDFSCASSFAISNKEEDVFPSSISSSLSAGWHENSIPTLSSAPSWLEDSVAHAPHPHKDGHTSHHEEGSASHTSGHGHPHGEHHGASSHHGHHGASSGHGHGHAAGGHHHPTHHHPGGGSVFHGDLEITEESAGPSREGSVNSGEAKGPTDAKGLKSFVASLKKAEKAAESENINADVEYQEAIESYLNSEDGLKLLDCIRVKTSEERKQVIEDICNGMKGKLLSACLTLRTSARMFSHGIEQNCKKKPMSQCLTKNVVLPVVQPLFTEINLENMYGMTATPFDFTRLSDIGRGKDFKVEGFDGLYIAEHTATFYGAVLDRREILKRKQQSRSTRFFSRRKTKTQAIRDYGMSAVVALARPPHVDPVMVKALMETLDLEGCPPDTTMEFHDLFGEKREVSTRALRKRLLAKRIGLTVQTHSTDHHPIADYNQKILNLYLQAFPQFEALALRAQGQPVALPQGAPEPPEERRNLLLRAIQQSTEARAFQYLEYDRKPPSRLATFFLGNKALRKTLSRWLQLLVTLGMPILRPEKTQAAEDAQGIVQGRYAQVYPQLFLNVNATAWVEYAAAFSVGSVFLNHPELADLQAQLVADNLKTVMMKHLRSERREAERVFEQKKEEAHKEAKLLKRQTKKAAKEKKRAAKKGGSDGAGASALVQLHAASSQTIKPHQMLQTGRFHAASFLMSKRRRNAKIISALGLIIALVAHIVGFVLGLGGFVFIPLAVSIIFAIILAVVWFIGRED